MSDNKNGPSGAVVAGGVALVSSILTNIGQHSQNQSLSTSVEALRGLVADWEVAYHSLDEQLSLALDANQALNAQVSALRNDLRNTQSRLYSAEQRGLNTEAKLHEAEATRKKIEGDLQKSKTSLKDTEARLRKIEEELARACDPKPGSQVEAQERG